MPHLSYLSADRRTEALLSLKAQARRGESIDILVIGGGITGVGIALDAASRGLTTVVVEAQDLAFGTSRWSSKLIHGGLRYLATGNVGIARHSAIERGVLMEVTAPHLIRRLPQVVPVYKSSSFANAVLPRLGFIAGDVLRKLAGTSARTLPRSTTISARTVAQMCPTVQQKGLLGGYLNWDGQAIDDARLVTAIARTAAEQGAEILTKVRAENVTGTSAQLTDSVSQESFTINAKCVVNATGVWAGQISPDIKVRPARGTHLVFDAKTFGNPTAALTVPVPGELNRFCFVLPQSLGRVYVGLTDEDSPGPIPDVPAVPESDVDFLLAVINKALAIPVTRADITGSYAGLRPLIDTGEDRTADLSRQHAILVGENGLISIVGGKLTEYRLMAEELVDKVVESAHLTAAPCSTRTLPLVGAPGHPQSLDTSAADLVGLPDSLVRRFGREAVDVVRTCPVPRPLDAVVSGVDVTRAEIAFAVIAEGAITIDDILERRTRIALVDTDRAAATQAVTDIVEQVRKAMADS